MARLKGSKNEKTLRKEAIRDAMEMYVFEHKDELISRMAKDPNYIRYLFDQVIGKPQDSLDLTTKGMPVNIQVVRYGDNQDSA